MTCCLHVTAAHVEQQQLPTNKLGRSPCIWGLTMLARARVLCLQANEPLAQFMDYCTYGHMIDNVVLIVTGTLHERDVQVCRLWPFLHVPDCQQLSAGCRAQLTANRCLPELASPARRSLWCQICPAS